MLGEEFRLSSGGICTTTSPIFMEAVMRTCAARRWFVKGRLAAVSAFAGGCLLLFWAPCLPAAERSQRDPDATRDKLLDEQLATGEFGPAIDAAHDIEDLAQRVRHLQKITAAQRSSGDFRGASETARRIP